MVINKNASKIQKYCVLQVMYFSLKFVETVFAFSPFDLTTTSIISSNVIAESSIILGKYLLFSQVHVEEFRI